MSSIANPAFFKQRLYHVPSTLGAAANAVLWNPNKTNTQMFDVYFNLVNTSTTDPRRAQVGIDVGRTAALTQHWFYGPIPAMQQSGWRGPFPILGSDQMMAWADAGNDVDIHWWAELDMNYAVGGP